MNKIVASVLGVASLLATAVPAPAQQVTPPVPPPVPAASQTTQAPYASTNPNQGVEQSRPLFSIGKLPVVVWAPVQPPYNSKMNRTQASNPLWDSEAY